MPTLYQILDVPAYADLPEIKRSFRRLSMQYHPDVNPGNPAAEARFRRILDAYKILSDPAQKLQYDESLRDGTEGEAQYKNWQSSPPFETASQPPYEPPGNTYQPETPLHRRRVRYIWAAVLIIAGIGLYTAGSREWKKADRLSASERHYSQPLNDPGNTGPSGATVMQLMNGDVRTFGNWSPGFSGQSLSQNFIPLGQQATQVLHIISGNGPDLYSRKNWIFQPREDGSLREVLQYTGNITIPDNRLRLHFGRDVDTFRSCLTCNLQGMPHPDVAGLYLDFRYGSFVFNRNPSLLLVYKVRENLAWLAGRQEETQFLRNDNGIRKEYLRQLLTWHYLFDDFKATQQLFGESYRYRDKEEMWTEVNASIKRYDKLLQTQVRMDTSTDFRSPDTHQR